MTEKGTIEQTFLLKIETKNTRKMFKELLKLLKGKKEKMKNEK